MYSGINREYEYKREFSRISLRTHTHTTTQIIVLIVMKKKINKLIILYLMLLPDEYPCSNIDLFFHTLLPLGFALVCRCFSRHSASNCTNVPPIACDMLGRPLLSLPVLLFTIDMICFIARSSNSR